MVVSNYIFYWFQNFEKITCRVQSKNKDQVVIVGKFLGFLSNDDIDNVFLQYFNFDILLLLFAMYINCFQVRYYYYRLVRRMNKLLGPGLYLDAKNSKDTNAAMLRW